MNEEVREWDDGQGGEMMDEGVKEMMDEEVKEWDDGWGEGVRWRTRGWGSENGRGEGVRWRWWTRRWRSEMYKEVREMKDKEVREWDEGGDEGVRKWNGGWGDGVTCRWWTRWWSEMMDQVMELDDEVREWDDGWGGEGVRWRMKRWGRWGRWRMRGWVSESVQLQEHLAHLLPPDTLSLVHSAVQCSSFPPEGVTGTSGYRFEYNLHLIKIPSQINRESIYKVGKSMPSCFHVMQFCTQF